MTHSFKVNIFGEWKEKLDSIHKEYFYSVNRYKLLLNRLLQKPLQTVRNSYKQLQTIRNQLLRKPLQTFTNSYKPLQTIYSINRYGPLHYQSDTTV